MIEAACDSAAYPPRTASRSSSLPYLRMASAAAAESGSGHGRLGRAELGADLVEPAGGQHAVDGQHVHVPGARVLRQVPDSA